MICNIQIHSTNSERIKAIHWGITNFFKNSQDVYQDVNSAFGFDGKVGLIQLLLTWVRCVAIQGRTSNPASPRAPWRFATTATMTGNVFCIKVQIGYESRIFKLFTNSWEKNPAEKQKNSVDNNKKVPGWPQESLLSMQRLGYHPCYPSTQARTTSPQYSIKCKLHVGLCKIPHQNSWNK